MLRINRNSREIIFKIWFLSLEVIRSDITGNRLESSWVRRWTYQFWLWGRKFQPRSRWWHPVTDEEPSLRVRAQNTFSGKFQALIHRRHFLLSASFHVFSMNKILPGTGVVGPPGSNISQMDFLKMTENSWHFPFSLECWVVHKWNFIRNCIYNL